jgi:hypothetical protein
MHAGHLAWLTCSCALVWLIWRVLHHYRLPRLPEQKLTRELIQHALLECTSPLVRLPASHGVLVTDPRLARKLLEGGHGAVRDVSDYARYRGFLDRSLVLLPQATATHATVCRTGLEPRTDRPLTGQVYCSHVWCLPWTARQNDPSRHDTRQRLARRASRHADGDATPRP